MWVTSKWTRFSTGLDHIHVAPRLILEGAHVIAGRVVQILRGDSIYRPSQKGTPVPSLPSGQMMQTWKQCPIQKRDCRLQDVPRQVTRAGEAMPYPEERLQAPGCTKASYKGKHAGSAALAPLVIRSHVCSKHGSWWHQLSSASR